MPLTAMPTVASACSRLTSVTLVETSMTALISPVSSRIGIEQTTVLAWRPSRVMTVSSLEWTSPSSKLRRTGQLGQT